MIKVGIVADDYKIERFKTKLNAAGFTDYELFPFTKGTHTIKVNIEESKVDELKKLCQNIELHFKRSN